MAEKDVLDKTVQFLQKREGIDKVHMACNTSQQQLLLCCTTVCFLLV